jgi:hypothetical protein
MKKNFVKNFRKFSLFWEKIFDFNCDTFYTYLFVVFYIMDGLVVVFVLFVDFRIISF